MFDTFEKVKILNHKPAYIADSQTRFTTSKSKAAKIPAKHSAKFITVFANGENIKIKTNDPDWTDEVYFENPNGDGALRCDISGVTADTGGYSMNLDFFGTYDNYSTLVTVSDYDNGTEDIEFYNALTAAFRRCEHERMY